jgi:hypothetical protein
LSARGNRHVPAVARHVHIPRRRTGPPAVRLTNAADCGGADLRAAGRATPTGATSTTTPAATRC